MSFARTTARTGKPSAAVSKATQSTRASPPVAQPSSGWVKPLAAASSIRGSTFDALARRGEFFDADAAAGEEDSIDLDDSVDESAWEAEIQSRQAFLHGIVGPASTVENTTPEPPRVAQPASKPMAPKPHDELRGLDDEEEVEPAPAASPLAAGSKQKTVVVPTLFDLAVAALGQEFHAIAEQDVHAVLPPGTLTQAIQAVRKAGLLSDNHLPLLFRTLHSTQVHSSTWLQHDCGLDQLVSSAIPDAESAGGDDLSASPPPSSSPSPSPAPATAAVAKPLAKPKPAASPSPLPAPVSRFAPLRGTPGVKVVGGTSLNSATLARQAKQAKLEAQIAGGMREPLATRPVKKPAAAPVVKSIRTTVSKPLVPKEFIFADGELLDLHAQFRITHFGFRLLTGFMDYTHKKANGVPVKEELEPDSIASREQARDLEDEFTDEQRARLAAVGVSDDIRALSRNPLGTASSSFHSSSLSNNDIPRPVLQLAHRLGIWRPVNIIHLDISFSGIDSTGLGMIARQCPNLLKVNICGCEKLTNSGVSDLARHCKQVQVLLMEVLPCLDDSAVQDVIHGMKQLLALDVGSCKKLTNVSFQIIGTHGKTLKRLSAAGCHQMTDFDVEEMAKCVSLLSLSLRACGKITDESISHLITLSKRKKKAKIRGLESLDIGGCVRLSDGSINALCVAYSASLTHLDLRGLTRLTNRSLDAIVAHCAKANILRDLNIGACPGITSERVQALRESWPMLHIVV